MRTPKERPILMSGPMVRAIIEGRKTQTRRIVKRQPIKGDVRPTMDEGVWAAQTERSVVTYFSCPYGQPLDHLYVKETFRESGNAQMADGKMPSQNALFDLDGRIIYRATDGEWEGPFRPSIFMPRWASSITLEIVSIRVERLNDISEEDAIAEGFDASTLGEAARGYDDCARYWYRNLWETINGKCSWKENPYVWVIEFCKVSK